MIKNTNACFEVVHLRIAKKKQSLVWEERLVGQKEILNALRHGVKTDTLSHALIFNGATGYGALPLAITLAQDLLCQQPVDARACGSCNACTQSSQLIHPDLHMAYPVVGNASKERKSITSDTYRTQWRELIGESAYVSLSSWINHIKTKSAKSDINVAECNQIYQRLSMTSFSGTKRVQIIWMAEQLGNNGNRLLKLIEEPPQGTVIILICEDKSRVLNTIISRCRTFDLLRIKEQELIDTLVEKHSITQDKAKQVAFLSEGNYLTALGFLEVSHEGLQQGVRALIQAAFGRDYGEMKLWGLQFSKYNIEEQRALILYLLKLLRENLHLKVIGEEHTRLGSEDLSLMRSIPSFFNLRSAQIESIHHLISDVYDLLGRNVNARMLMFNACLKIDSVVHNKEVIPSGVYSYS